jgi:hypothetical protein
MAMSEDEKAVQSIKDPKARKAAYYTRQRQDASAGSATQKKIQSKLSWGDAARGFAKDQMQKIKASGPFSIPGARAEEGAAAGVKMLGKGVSALAKRGEGAMENAVQTLKKPTPVAKAGPRLGSSGAPRVRTLDSIGKPKAVSGTKTKALTSKGHSDYESELGKQSKKTMPGKPKTFNRDGSKRATGRVKSERNPVSKRKKKGD